MGDQNPREIAARVLQRRDTEGRFVESLLDEALTHSGLSSKDRALCQELVYGTVRWQGALNWLITRKTQGRPQRKSLQILLQLGLYQLFWLSRVPAHAAVHETVELGRNLGFGNQAGFLNAVLRGYVREQEPTRRLLEELKRSDPAAGFSHPPWLHQRWRQRWGETQAAALMQWNNTPPPTFARVNALKTSADNLARIWEGEGVKFSARQYDWTDPGTVFALEEHPPLQAMSSFQHGLFYVQDPSTLLAVRELDPQPGDIILDACSAPGGKTTFIAQWIRNRGHVIAQDVQPDRLALVRENAVRLGVTCIAASAAPEDSSGTPSNRFDRILVDAPCSNTGVLRRRVELRWRIRPGEIDRLRRSQSAILRQAALRLKPGGLLVYSTCSLEPEENRGVVEDFLKEHRAFGLERERELLPMRDGVDGAYVARLRAAL